jgi:hypothetical protein
VSEEKPMIGDGVRLGVELFASDVPDLPTRRGDRDGVDDDDDYAPASGKYRPFGRGWQRTVVEYGHDTVEAATRVMGEQVSTVLREALIGMDRAPLPATTESGLVTSSVQLTFGLKLTVGAGKVIEAVISAGGEASVQVAVTLTYPV